MSLRQIAKVFNDEKIPTKGHPVGGVLKRGQWWASTVNFILKDGLWVS